jgi:predicted lipoprotein
MLASIPVSMVNQKIPDLGIPNRINLNPSRLSRADETYCARVAERMKDPEARAAFVELAQQWRALAQQFSGPEADHHEE